MRAVLFHNVIAEPTDPFDRALERLHVNAFRRELDYLRARYRIVSHDEALASLQAGTPSDDALVLTFDDGFAGVKDVAAPVLAELGLPASVFVLTEPGGVMRADRLFHFERLEIAFRLTTKPHVDFTFAGDGIVPLTNDATRVSALKAIKRRFKAMPHAEYQVAAARLIDALGVSAAAITKYASGLHKFRKLTIEDCRTLAGAGWTIGGHTRTHASLRQTVDETMTSEIAGNAADLAAVGFVSVPFAFPYGGDAHVDDRAKFLVEKSGFSCAWTTVPGENTFWPDRFALRRFSVPALHQLDARSTRTDGNR